MEPNKSAYLQMIQEPINRMSTMSSIFKGFCSTIVAGISGLGYETMNLWILILSFLPVLAFAVLDVYYLSLERKFRYLYSQVASGEHACDFKMDLINRNNKSEMKKAKASIKYCIQSPSFWLFYPLMFLICVIVIFMKAFGGV